MHVVHPITPEPSAALIDDLAHDSPANEMHLKAARRIGLASEGATFSHGDFETASD